MPFFLLCIWNYYKKSHCKIRDKKSRSLLTDYPLAYWTETPYVVIRADENTIYSSYGDATPITDNTTLLN